MNKNLKNFMTAAEARKRSDSIRETQSIAELQEVMENVELAVKKGETMTYHYNSLSQETIDILEREPNLYKIRRMNDWKDGYYYEIHW